MTALPTGIGAITLFVEDPSRSKAFYERVLGAPLLYEDNDAATFKLDNTLLNLLRTGAAHELIEPAVVGDAGSGSRFQLTLWVPDADAACAQLKDRGVVLLNGPLDRSWGVRTAAFADPDGHVWEVAQQMRP
jgi:catechol 2,3-dioxygenase-like lactoylglutathione lyase family enzyme